MKKIILIFILPILAFSQDETEDLYPFSFGAGIYSKASINAVIQPETRKTKPLYQYVPDFFINSYLPYSTNSNIGLYFELGFNSQQYYTENASTGENYTASLYYITFNPYLYIEGFLLGFGAGLPFSSDYGLPSGVSLPNDSTDSNKRLNNIFEIRLGYNYTLYEDYNGRLNISLIAAYSMNGIFRDFVKNDPYKNVIAADEDYPITRIFNPRIASINIGVSYFFYIDL